jgi:hypothetical protein
MYELNETCSGKPLMDSKLWFILNYAIRKVVYFIFAVITVISLRSYIRITLYLQLIRRIQGQDGDVTGEDVPATPKKIFQILHQVFHRFF